MDRLTVPLVAVGPTTLELSHVAEEDEMMELNEISEELGPVLSGTEETVPEADEDSDELGIETVTEPLVTTPLEGPWMQVSLVVPEAPLEKTGETTEDTLVSEDGPVRVPVRG